MSEIAIIGGGLVGTSVALRLLELGARVTLVDGAHRGQATAAGAGILPPLDHFIGVPALLPLLAAARAHYPELVAKLERDQEGRVGYDVIGALQVATSEAELAELPRLADAAEARRADGFRHIGEVTELTAAQARSLFPLLGPAVLGGLHCSGAARIDGRRLLTALRSCVRARGGELREGSAELWIERGGVVGVTLAGEVLGADAVVVAGGAWSSALLAPLGVSLPVVPQRGQLLHLDVPGHSTGTWPVVLGFSHQYLLGFPDSRLVAGATREEVGYDARVTLGGVSAVMGAALELAPGLHAATLVEARVGFRPVSADRKPLLGPLASHPNVFIATGHAGYGLELGPYSGVLLAELVAGRSPAVDLAPFAPNRFAPSATRVA